MFFFQLNVEHRSDISCLKAKCPPILCSVSEYIYAEDSCCPTCPANPQFTVIRRKNVTGYLQDPENDDYNDRRKRLLENGGCLERKVGLLSDFLVSNIGCFLLLSWSLMGQFFSNLIRL